MLDTVRLFLPRLPPALASAQARARVEAIAAGLPFLTAGGFECRLERGDEIVDFHVAFPADRETFRSPDVHPAWRLLAEVSRGRTEPQSAFYRTTDEVILEFDLHGDVRGNEVPSIFLSLVPDAGRDAAAIRALARALGSSDGHKTADASLDRLLAALPDAGRVGQLGVMHARHNSHIRLNVADLTPEIALGVLRRLAPRVGDAAADALRPVGPLLDWLQLAVDLSDGPMEKVGLECFLSAQPSHEPRWRQLVDLLVTRGVCDGDKGRALLDWPGLITRQDAVAWPAGLEWSDRFMAVEASSLFVCGINHIKFVVAPDCAPRAKAYLSFRHRWLDRRSN